MFARRNNTGMIVNGHEMGISVHGASGFAALKAKLIRKTATIGVIGQGYVGFPLAQEAAKRGFETYGYDINLDTIARCQQENQQRRYHGTVAVSSLRQCDVLIVAVPTPTRDTATSHEPDLSLVVNAITVLAGDVLDGERARLLIVESTYAPGTTRNVVAPLLAAHHHVVGENVFLGYSPERIDPGNQRFSLANTPKVTSGIDAASAELVHLFYDKIVDTPVAASSMEAAEATKILENSFRFVNITFAQEFDAYCAATGIEAREVTRLASTKPFGYMPFYAGAGIGGHCIAEDPYFLYEAMLEAGLKPSVLEGAIKNHESRADVIVERIRRRLGGRSLAGTRILLLGVSYKPNIGDARRSPAHPILERLDQAGARVEYHDPHVPRYLGHRSIDLSEATPTDYDLAVIITAHTAVDCAALANDGWRLLDTTGTMGPASEPVAQPRTAAYSTSRRGATQLVESAS